jgi:hypothetical protein
MDEQAVRAALQRHFDHSATDADVAHEIYHDDDAPRVHAVGERFEGIELS